VEVSFRHASSDPNSAVSFQILNGEFSLPPFVSSKADR